MKIKQGDIVEHAEYADYYEVIDVEGDTATIARMDRDAEADWLQGGTSYWDAPVSDLTPKMNRYCSNIRTIYHDRDREMRRPVCEKCGARYYYGNLSGDWVHPFIYDHHKIVGLED